MYDLVYVYVHELSDTAVGNIWGQYKVHMYNIERDDKCPTYGKDELKKV